MTDREPGKPREPSPPATDDSAAAKKAEGAGQPTAEEAKLPWEESPVAPEWQEADGDELVEALRSRHREGLRWARSFAGDLVIGVEREAIREIARDLKEGHGYHLLVDICGAHYPEREEAPFEVIYIAHNLETGRRVRLKVQTDEASPVPSVTTVWGGANWTEREVFDMFGVTFADHPDLTRILLWEGFNGHPLRKDFPVEGIDTGAAIYPEYYESDAGPIAGTGTGWKPPQPAPEGEEEAET